MFVATFSCAEDAESTDEFTTRLGIDRRARLGRSIATESGNAKSGGRDLHWQFDKYAEGDLATQVFGDIVNNCAWEEYTPRLRNVSAHLGVVDECEIERFNDKRGVETRASE